MANQNNEDADEDDDEGEFWLADEEDECFIEKEDKEEEEEEDFGEEELHESNDRQEIHSDVGLPSVCDFVQSDPVKHWDLTLDCSLLHCRAQTNGTAESTKKVNSSEHTFPDSTKLMAREQLKG